jgi:threonine aldolase
MESLTLMIRVGSDIHCPETGLICLENALANGRVVHLDKMNEVYQIAKKHDIPVHLDGARLFNASAYLKVDAKEITKYCDSVMFCLSKGLCAPVGSILAGSKEFIEMSKRGRKLMGGGLRQSGILAAAGLIALRKMTQRLEEDHENALVFGKELSKIPGIGVNLDDIHINMVFFKVNIRDFDAGMLVDELLKNGIKVNPPDNGMMRFVTHYWVSREDVLHVVNIIRAFIK